MHTAIQHSAIHYQYLTIGSRKPTLKNRLLVVTQGLVLIKLGKLEYCVTENQSFWLPANCLCAISYFPNSKVQSVEFSQRITEKFPTRAGNFISSPLLLTALTRLSNPISDKQNASLLEVIKHELLIIEPELNFSIMCKKISSWQVTTSDLDKELLLALKLRAALKLKQSGKNSQIIADELFDTNIDLLSSMGKVLLGKDVF